MCCLADGLAVLIRAASQPAWGVQDLASRARGSCPV